MAERKKIPYCWPAGAQEFKKQKLPGFLYAEKKMDGIRGVIIVRNKKARAYTKNGCRVFNADHILRVIEQAFDDCVLDGEYLYKKNFDMTSSIVMSMSKHPLRKGLQFNAFDMISWPEWRRKKCKTRLADRKLKLSSLIGKYKKELKKLCNYVDHDVIYGKAKAMQEFMDAQVEAGHEGGVFKDPDSFYAFQKSKDWLKMKPYIEGDFKIIDAIEGRPGKTGKYIGMLGALVVKGEINGEVVQFQTSGMLDAHRKEWWQLHKKKKLKGLIVEVKHEGITKNKKVRFPRVMKLKLDRTYAAHKT